MKFLFNIAVKYFDSRRMRKDLTAFNSEIAAFNAKRDAKPTAEMLSACAILWEGCLAEAAKDDYNNVVTDRHSLAIQMMSQVLHEAFFTNCSPWFFLQEVRRIEDSMPALNGIARGVAITFLPNLKNYFSNTDEAPPEDMRLLAQQVALSFPSGSSEEEEAASLWNQLNRRLNSYMPGEGFKEAIVVVGTTPQDRLLNKMARDAAKVVLTNRP